MGGKNHIQGNSLCKINIRSTFYAYIDVSVSTGAISTARQIMVTSEVHDQKNKISLLVS